MVRRSQDYGVEKLDDSDSQIAKRYCLRILQKYRKKPIPSKIKIKLHKFVAKYVVDLNKIY